MPDIVLDPWLPGMCNHRRGTITKQLIIQQMNELRLGSFENMEEVRSDFWPGEARQASRRRWHDLVQEGQMELGIETLKKVFQGDGPVQTEPWGWSKRVCLISVKETCGWEQGIYQGGQRNGGLEWLVSQVVEGLLCGTECGLYFIS